MADLRSKHLILLKGGLFLAIAAVCAALILLELPSGRIALLLALLVWSACRFYYFLFYVLEQYVDPGLKYAGVLALLQALGRRLTRPGRSR